MSDLDLVLGNPTQTIIEEVSDPGMNQKDVAKTYALAMDAESKGQKVQWPVVNGAIMGRWSPAGLERIKQLAHTGRCWE